MIVRHRGKQEKNNTQEEKQGDTLEYAEEAMKTREHDVERDEKGCVPPLLPHRSRNDHKEQERGGRDSNQERQTE